MLSSILRAVAVLVLAAPLAAQPTAADRILAETERSPTLEANLRTLCDEIGPRPAGSPAMRRAAEWAVGAFEAAGAQNAHIEEFEIPRLWREGDTQLKVRGEQTRFSVEAVATAYSPATPPGGVEAELVDGGAGTAGRVERLGKRAHGKVVLVRLSEATTFFQIGVEQRNAIHAIREAGKVGAAGVIFASTRPNRLLFRHIHTVNLEPDPVPSVVVTRADANRLHRLLADGPIRVRLSSPAELSGPAPGWNVSAEIRGSEKPEEIVILGAHLDSWDLGSGCVDNAVNVALTIETARAIVAADARPKRTLRFVLFGGEEVGLIGSAAYVRAHRAELDRITAVLIHDMGLGRIKGYYLGGRAELEEPLVEAMRPVASRARFQHSRDAFFGSDHFDFLLEGVPALVAEQDTSDYVLPYHSEADTYDQVSLLALRDRTSVAAATAYGLANLPERFGKRLSRAELERLLRDNGVDDQLQFLRLWEAWQSGKRGREKEPHP